MKSKRKPTQYKRGLAAALDELHKQFGKKSLFVPPTRRYIPMRHQGLARLLSGETHPGLPTGTFIEVRGMEHSGKTTLGFAMMDAVINQPDGTQHTIHTDNGVETIDAPRKVLYMDFEQTLDVAYMQSAVRNVRMLDVSDTGKLVNPEDANVFVHQPDTLDEGCDIMLHLLASGEFGLVVNDSVAAMLTEDERSKSMGENTVGVLPRQVGKFFRKSAHVVRRYGVVACMINQWRDKIGVAFGDPRTAPGGKALGYWDSVLLDVSGPKKSPWFPGEGKVCNIKAMKNKISGEKATATYHLRNGWGLSAEVELHDMALRAGIIVAGKGGSVRRAMPGGVVKKYASKLEFVEALRANDKMFNRIAKDCAAEGVHQAAYVSPKETAVAGWDEV